MPAEAISYPLPVSFPPNPPGSTAAPVLAFSGTQHAINYLNNEIHSHYGYVTDLNEFEPDLLRINELQEQFNYELGISGQQKLNYNPVLARWKFETIQNTADLEQFKQYELWQIRTALYERNQVEKNAVHYTIGKDGEIYNELFPDEPFRNVLLRGIAYQNKHGSVDTEREQAEFDGWQKICDTLKHPGTPEHTKAVVISGPSLAEGSPYRHNFIDIYEALDDPVLRKRFIKMTRTTSNLSYEAYRTIAQYFDPDYFTDSDGRIDAFHLGKPIFRDPRTDSRTAAQIITEDFGLKENLSVEERKAELWNHVCEVATHFLEHGICNGKYDPVEIAKKWNALLVKNDLVWDAIRNKVKSGYAGEINKPEFKSLYDEIVWLSSKEIQTVAAACGASAGFNTNDRSAVSNETSLSSILENSVAQFGLSKDKYGDRKFDCPKCSYKNTRPFGKLLDKCQKCGSTEVACKNEKED